jgi:ABC-type dipeptide/oligopeptide/nickel transport system permease subunit
MMQKHQLGKKLMLQREYSVKCVYSYAVSGGTTTTTISLLDEDGRACVIPNKAIVRDVLIDVVTAPTSNGSATIALGTGQAANDIKTATGYGSFSALMAGIPVGTAATAIKMTADRTPIVTVATAALTAGKMNVHIKYQLSE